MELRKLQQHIRRLAGLEETSDPVTSCYLNLERSRDGYRNAWEEGVRALRATLSGRELTSFEEALALIEQFISDGFEGDARRDSCEDRHRNGADGHRPEGDHPGYKTITPDYVWATAGLVLATGVAYWLVFRLGSEESSALPPNHSASETTEVQQG